MRDIIKFLRRKDFKFLEEIGQGGTGKTILVKDEIIDEVFVCKKYSPFSPEDKEIYYKYFLDEIKILHTLYHKNIVRVFNYYLYPDQKTGYILMEYIKGKTISKYILENPDKLEDVFIQTIEGFRYLEDKNILHRDIRPENLLISIDGMVKIIDFGFGKFIDFENENKSISLNWRYSIPSDFENQIYDFTTEVYFIGKLFEEILKNINNINFKYSRIVSKMIFENRSERIATFFDIYRELLDVSSNENEFTYSEKNIYQQFANSLQELFVKMPFSSTYNTDIDAILRFLEALYKNSILEDYIQNCNKLTSIFILGKYTYYRNKQFPVSVLLEFIQLLKSVSEDKRKIILNHLWERFDKIIRYTDQPVDDLPF